MPNPPPQQYPLMDLPIGALDFAEYGGNEPKLAQEDMSAAFLSGLVAQAGLQINPPQRHDDGIDFSIGCKSALINGVRRAHPHLYVQLKSTSRPELAEDAVIFRKLTRERYAMLVDPTSTVPQALIVYVMPDDRLKWIMPGPCHVDFVGHAFFLNMRDAPAIGPDDPMKVTLPFANRLTTCSLVQFFHDAVAKHYP